MFNDLRLLTITGKKMMKILNIVLLFIFVLFALLFTIYNPERVSIKFLSFQSIKLPISVVVFSSIIIGILITLIFHFYAVYKLKKGVKTGNTEIKAGNNNIDS